MKKQLTIGGVFLGIALLLAICGAVAGNENTFTLRAAAGSGNSGLIDGASAASSFHLPMGIGVNEDGTLIVADTGNHTLRLIQNGQVSTLAGLVNVEPWPGNLVAVPEQRAGYLDTEALSSKFNEPRDVLAISDGLIIVADSGNNVLRRIREGKVQTFSGAGQAGLRDGKREEALFNKPVALAAGLDGVIYVADSLNNAIRFVNPQGEVTTLSGGPEAGYTDGKLAEARFSEPCGLAFDRENNRLFVADSGNHRIRLIDLAAGEVSTYAGAGSLDPNDPYAPGAYLDGPAAEAMFNAPKGLVLIENKVLLVADSGNDAIRIIALSGDRVVTTLVDGQESGSLRRPLGLAYAGGMLYVADSWSNQIKEGPYTGAEEGVHVSKETLEKEVSTEANPEENP